MELRKVEQELENLSSEWKALRRKRPRFNDDAGPAIGGPDEALSTQMPSWKELKSTVNDDELFPPEEVEEEEEDINMENGSTDANNDKSGTDATNNTDSKDADNTAGYSDFGMCLAPSANGAEKGAESTTKSDGGTSVWERYAAKNTVAAAKSQVAVPEVATSQKQTMDDNADDSEEEEEVSVEDASPKDIIAGLESLHERFVALGPKIDKFNIKLKERDPVSKKPRYGAKTYSRVKHVIRTHKALEQGVAIVFNETCIIPSIVSSLRSQIQHHTQQLNIQKQSHQSQQQLEEERLAKEKLLAKERADQRRLLEEQRKRDEEKELFRLAEEARVRRAEEEQRASEAERRVDEELLAFVPTIGADGVREQIGRMREALKDDRAALDVALGSLYTLFEQIVRKPEEINFRRVRRDHPKFMEDIGRHVGGREVLIAAGFKLDKLDGVPSFFSKEPHIESDMDGWSNWFDMLKKTLEVIEEEMLK
eukprot:CAMPEP_0172314192 /NCGR_PEP_ID=MMETSP1058-20130122/21908_1 /TAXON_ID=83371 /ORGANISM="Detonula confervacea, Strain CCMP 353" /LENGTH=480 /DNA_ID=CAMNT_0013027995 /DNA_START=84 /DNA_END=1526 /DNA_ORIENTATION=+